MLLLLDHDEETGQYPPTSIFRCAWPSFTYGAAGAQPASAAGTDCGDAPWPRPWSQEWRSACAQCEDSLYRHARNKALGPQMDRVKGYMLLQAGELVQATQHYAMCTTEHDAWWPRTG